MTSMHQVGLPVSVRAPYTLYFSMLSNAVIISSFELIFKLKFII